MPWINDDLRDIAKMTDKQRMTYWRMMGTVDIANLKKNGNFVGEKPEREINIEEWIVNREAAHQRAMAYQEQIWLEDVNAS